MGINDHYLYEQFKQYNRTNDRDVECYEQEPRLPNLLNVYMKNGDVIQYDDMYKTVRYCTRYERDDRGDYVMSDDEYKRAFSENLKRIMMSRRMNQKMLSDSTGINPATINHYMKGRNLPDMLNIRRICRALECTFEDLSEFN